MARRYWLIKSEPYKYAWSELVADGSTFWDGVRNYEARNNLRAMKLGDLCLYYHSNKGKEVVGVARVCVESYQDPTTEDERWSGGGRGARRRVEGTGDSGGHQGRTPPWPRWL